MANEIKIYTSLKVEKPLADIDEFIEDTFYATMTGTIIAKGVQTIGTVEEILDIVADLTPFGYCWLKNITTDLTDYIEIGVSAGVYTVKLMPGKHCIFMPAANVLRCKATDAACDLKYLLIQV